MSRLLAVPVAFMTSAVAWAASSESDDFRGASRQWKPDQAASAGGFVVANDRLEYRTVRPPTSNDNATRTWKMPVGIYNKDWSVRVDVSIGEFEMPDNGHASVTLSAKNVADSSSDMVRIQMRRSGGGRRYILSESFVDNKNVGSQTSPTQATSCALQISYVASTHTMTASFDEDGAENGYSFVPSSSYDIAAEGASWGMAGKDPFEVTLVGTSVRTVVKSGDIFVDNFTVNSADVSAVAKMAEPKKPLAPLAPVELPTPPAPAPNAPPVAGAPAAIQSEVMGSRIDVLKVQGPNAIEWALAPLTQPIPGDIRQNLTYLREDLLDEAKQKPGASPSAYTLGSQLCNALLAIFEEQSQTLARAGFRAVEANARTGVTSQTLEARRNYMMTWTQYAREESQRDELKSQAVNSAAVMAERPKLAWTQRTSELRKPLDNLYAKFREALRQQ